MNNYGKAETVRSTGESNLTMREIASTVFRKVGNDLYEVTKTRDGEVVLGGRYSRLFVRTYVMSRLDVYIEGGR